ncbi:MAG: hypothetical protein ABI304_03045, partial [Rudaea sp.]
RPRTRARLLGSGLRSREDTFGAVDNVMITIGERFCFEYFMAADCVELAAQRLFVFVYFSIVSVVPEAVA